MDKIKITEDMEFDFQDLMEEIDLTHEFTLKDVLEACMNSVIPIDILSDLLQCPYIEDYYKEMSKEKTDEVRDILYLQLSYAIDQDDDAEYTSHGWTFDGVGEAGLIPQDLLDNCTEEEIKRMREDGYTQKYALEFTPISDLVGYTIKISDEIKIINWNDKASDEVTTIKGKPSIRLIDALYEIFWELSFLGSPEERDEKGEDLLKRVDEYKKAKEDGTLKLIDFEEVKKTLLEKYGTDI